MTSACRPIFANYWGLYSSEKHVRPTECVVSLRQRAINTYFVHNQALKSSANGSKLLQSHDPPFNVCQKSRPYLVSKVGPILYLSRVERLDRVNRADKVDLIRLTRLQ